MWNALWIAADLVAGVEVAGLAEHARTRASAIASASAEVSSVSRMCW